MSVCFEYNRGVFFFFLIMFFFLISSTLAACACHVSVCTHRMLMREKWRNCVKLSYTVLYCMWFIDFSVWTHTCWGQAQIWFTESETGIERWCVNGCSCLSHPGLFFSSLSLNSPLAQCWRGKYWILADMFSQVWVHARCAECSNMAHTHTHALSPGCEKENRKEKRLTEEEGQEKDLAKYKTD